MVTPSIEPPCTLALRAGALPSRLTCPPSMRSAAAVREKPSSREIATSSRRPSSPSGTGSSRVSAMLPRAPRGARAVQGDAEQAQRAGEDRAADDRRVGEIEDWPVLGVRTEQ